MKAKITILVLLIASIAISAESWINVQSSINKLAIYNYDNSLGPRIDVYFDNDPSMLYTTYLSSFSDPEGFNNLVATLLTAYSTGVKVDKIWGHPNSGNTKYYIYGVQFEK